ncbi:MAG: acetyl-CoA carboxylase biotin carboxyl carrier protein [bacterium]|nr:acetyl-CoA carboxylase biotin carboxyl carrier protein [bacterium]
MDYKEIKRVIALMKKEELLEFEYEKEGTKLRIVRGHPAQVQMPLIPHFPGTQPVPKQLALDSGTKPAEEKAAEVKPDNLVTITSPMVGTFYRAPAPDAAPFVEIGDIVEENKTLCILEAMKLMNELKSEFRCKIIDVLVKNAQPVEFGQPLFKVEKL